MKMKPFDLVVGVFFVLSLTKLALADSPPKTNALVAKGKATYVTSCLTCHGEKGDGNGPAGAFMNPKPRDLIKEKFKKGDKPIDVFNSISNGVEGTSMTAYAYLSEEDRWGLTYYVLSLRSKKGAR